MTTAQVPPATPDHMDQFLTRRKLWNNALLGEHEHSILRQLQSLTWDMAVWRTVNEARRIAELDANDTFLNGPMYDLLDRCFAESFLIRLRKVVGSKCSSLTENKFGVYSFVSVLKDMKEHADLLTREAILKAENSHLDLDDIPKNDYSRRLHWKHRMDDIDKLCNVTSENRKPHDHIPEQYFDRMNNELLKTSENVNNYVNKIIAHAATPSSINEKFPSDEKPSLKWRQLWDALKILTETFAQLAIVIPSGLSQLLPYPQYDVVKCLDKALVRSSDLGDLRRFWTNITDETRAWFGQCR